MANLSKIKRDKMLAFIDELKAQQTDENNILMLNNIRNELDGKRYGLVWEEHTEHVDEQLTDNIPVFKEEKSREIVSDENLPYNFLLEGDNLHSLKLLEKTHKGKIDVIYIDPPYNTGAKDWKYDNDFVDSNDTFRHSKWLSLMYERIVIAKNILSNTGIIVVTIDDYEFAPLKLLLDSIFGENNFLGTIVIRNNPSGRSTIRGLSINHEYALFYAKTQFSKLGRLQHNEIQKKRYNEYDKKGFFEWENFRKNGTDSDKKNRPKQYYPLFVNVISKRVRVPKILWNDSCKEWVLQENPNSDEKIIFPVSNKGKEKVWKYGVDRTKEIFSELRVVDKNGVIEVYRKKYLNTEGSLPHTWWDKAEYSARDNGTRMLTNIFGPVKVFDFPKAIEAVKDTMISANLPSNGVVLDFFAGSGTTGHAVMELNKEDGGNRKFILCTNNENNICEDVTYQRLKTVITGKRKDGSKYSDGIPANLKYFKTDWTKRHPEDYFLSHALLLHITEMIELQNAIKVDNKKYVVVLREKDFTNYVANNADRSKIKKLWIREDLILSNEQNKLLQKIKFAYIPREYFSVELQEVGE